MMFVRNVDLECRDLKQCCEGDKVMCGVMLLRTILSSILERWQRRYGLGI